MQEIYLIEFHLRKLVMKDDGVIEPLHSGVVHQYLGEVKNLDIVVDSLEAIKGACNEKV